MIFHHSIAEHVDLFRSKEITILNEGEFMRCEGGGGGPKNPELENAFLSSYRVDNRTATYVGESRGIVALLLMDVEFSERTDDIQSSLSLLWQELQLPPAIPFSAEERQKLVGISNGLLTPYIERHRRAALSRTGHHANSRWD